MPPPIIQLARTVRFCLNDPPPPADSADDKHNTFSAWPMMAGLGRYYELTVTCAGVADPATGYFLNIKVIDDAVRTHVLPTMQQALSTQAGGAIALGTLMRHITTQLNAALQQTVQHVCLHFSPLMSIALRSEDMNHVILRQTYEFSAAHRLHVPDLSDAENRRLFGKCNNPSGHGHNYRLQVAVRAPIDDAAGGRVAPLADLDAAVDAAVIQKLDHKHLNHDVPAFAARNPTVENITMVVYDMLIKPLAALGLALDEVCVWETSKTACTYRGPQHC